ncbi:hypothetical protein [Halococcus morrhuae]|uniref:hypothetical protein n=1 Tax=Halococcus morrhuae TaxID=2250 RepID=UPI0012674945|nr:hypothetical protein [Halococcus morrhuae]
MIYGAILTVETNELIPDPAAGGASFRALGERGLFERFDGVLVRRTTAPCVRRQGLFDQPFTRPDEAEEIHFSHIGLARLRSYVTI